MPESFARIWEWVQKNAAAVTLVLTVLGGIWYLAENLATKEDLAGLATQESLVGLASQEDLTALASRDDLAKLATQVETAVETLDTAVSALNTAVQTLNTGIGVLGNSVAALQETVRGLDVAAASADDELSAMSRAVADLTGNTLPSLVRCLVALHDPIESTLASASAREGADAPAAPPRPGAADACRALLQAR